MVCASWLAEHFLLLLFKYLGMNPWPAFIGDQADGRPTHGGLVVVDPSRVADSADIAGAAPGLENFLGRADPVRAAVAYAELVHVNYLSAKRSFVHDRNGL